MTITISKLLYDTLRDNSKWLQCLRAAGVDEWSGFESATARYREWGQIRREVERRAVVEVDPTVQAMREAGWSDDTLREMGLL